MTKNDAIATVIEDVLEIECVYKTDVAGTGFYDVTQRPPVSMGEEGHSINRFLGESYEMILHLVGVDLQFSDHGSGRRSIQAFAGAKRVLVADVSYGR